MIYKVKDIFFWQPIDDSEDEEDSASTSYLSDVEVETEFKGQVEEEELIVVDESTEIEMEEGDITGDKQKKEVTIGQWMIGVELYFKKWFSLCMYLDCIYICNKKTKIVNNW